MIKSPIVEQFDCECDLWARWWWWLLVSLQLCSSYFRRTVESNLYNKMSELQEEICLKKLDLRVAQLHLAAVKAQVNPTISPIWNSHPFPSHLSSFIVDYTQPPPSIMQFYSLWPLNRPGGYYTIISNACRQLPWLLSLRWTSTASFLCAKSARGEIYRYRSDEKTWKPSSLTCSTFQICFPQRCFQFNYAY